jgi:opacity protein-like surface antigen
MSILKRLINSALVFGVMASSATALAEINETQYTPPVSDKTFSSGVYIGIQGSYVFTVDDIKFDASYPSNPSFVPFAQTNHLNSYAGNIYLGYGYLIDHGYLPYIGAELGFGLRSNYNSGASVDDGSIYGQHINAPGELSFDITPGFFVDDTKTTLVYLRLGIEGDQFEMDSDTGGPSDTKYYPLLRVGAGIEHELVDNVYLRLDYVLAVDLQSEKFQPYLPTYDDTYSSKTMFNTFSLGITYRF